jgi:hypothetical protein
MNMNHDPHAASKNPEWTQAIYEAVRLLVERGYLHVPDDVEFVRPGYKSVFPCGKAYGSAPLDLSSLQWSAENGSFAFCWYGGTHLKLNLHKDTIRRQLKLDPLTENAWKFAFDVCRTTA